MASHRRSAFPSLSQELNRNANRKSGTPVTVNTLSVKCPMVRQQWYNCPKMTMFQYRYVGVNGVGDREKNDRKRPSRFFGFVSFGQPKNRLPKVGFLSGKTEKNQLNKPTSGFRFTTLRTIQISQIVFFVFFLCVLSSAVSC